MTDLPNDPRFITQHDRVRNQLELERILTPIFLAEPSASWIERLTAADIPCSPLYDYGQVLADPHVVQSGLLGQVELPGGGIANALASAVTMSGFDMSGLRRPPRLGESTAEVVDEWTEVI